MHAQAAHPRDPELAMPSSTLLSSASMAQVISALKQDQPSWLQELLLQYPPSQREIIITESLTELTTDDSVVIGPLLSNWLLKLSSQKPLAQQSIVMEDYQILAPLYDYPSLARQLLQQRTAEQLTQRYTEQLLQGQFPWGLVFRRGNPQILQQQRILLNSIEALSPEQLSYIYQHLPNDLFFPDNQLTSKFACLSLDWDITLQSLNLPSDQYTLAVLKVIPIKFPKPQALELLQLAARNPELNYFAIQQVYLLGQSYAPARDYLKQLPEEHRFKFSQQPANKH